MSLTLAVGVCLTAARPPPELRGTLAKFSGPVSFHLFFTAR